MFPNGYYTEKELDELNIKHGKNVLISRKVSIYSDNMEVGDNVRIDDFCILIGDLKLGSFIHIAAYCLLSGSSGIVLEDFVGIASRTLVFSQSDDYSGAYLTGPLIDEAFTNVTKGTVYLRKHSIIGAGCVILPAVTLAEGSSIGAMSLINKNTENWSIYMGVPAKKIKARKKNLLELEMQFLESRT